MNGYNKVLLCKMHRKMMKPLYKFCIDVAPYDNCSNMYKLGSMFLLVNCNEEPQY